jgi:hypothetical protein
LLLLTIPDPMHVLIRKGPSEFTCGPQSPNPVKVDYAVSDGRTLTGDGILRGIEFR